MLARRALWFGVTLTCVLVAGCGSRGPALGRVEGTVTLDGVPLGGARIIFTPVDGGRASMAVTDGSGHYELEFAGGVKGAVVGKHKVSISTFEAGEKDDTGKLVGHVPERVPPRYNKDTILEQEVKRGHQVIDFKLESR
ncbi:MAG TPA: carboxypeptidase-like regulatory domain-containing protein [Thermogutta sp.]|nr:carboxypeptidase-like regulatory domain-containing protein [Thermogutta sp.]HPU05128.1 carboxypeptidase-like regulatory domain-containing protein [Thermogutta sp.]